MKIYVAGASADMDSARRAMADVRARGHEITLDWITEIEKAGAANEGLTADQQLEHAQADMLAVREADLVWVVTPEDRAHGCGLWVEMGAAIAYGVPVVISGPQAKRSIFSAFCAVFPFHDHALMFVDAMAMGRGERVA